MSTDSARENASTTRVLFLGNSFTYFNGGVPEHLQRMCGSVRCDAVTQGGATLSRLWRKVSACKKQIRSGAFDVVVLQDDLPELRNAGDFERFVGKFVALARQCGARPLIYMCWAYERLEDRISQDEVEKLHRNVAISLGVDVIPVGCARSELPNMWADDMEHPSLQGTVLAAAMVLKYLLPDRVWDPGAYLPDGLALEEAYKIRDVSVAWSPPVDCGWSFGQDSADSVGDDKGDSVGDSEIRRDGGALNVRAAVEHLLDEHVAFSVASLLPAEELTNLAVTCTSFRDVVCRSPAFDASVWACRSQQVFGLVSRGRQPCWRLAFLLEQEDRAMMDAHIMLGMC